MVVGICLDSASRYRRSIIVSILVGYGFWPCRCLWRFRWHRHWVNPKDLPYPHQTTLWAFLPVCLRGANRNFCRSHLDRRHAGVRPCVGNRTRTWSVIIFVQNNEDSQQLVDGAKECRWDIYGLVLVSGIERVGWWSFSFDGISFLLIRYSS